MLGNIKHASSYRLSSGKKNLNVYNRGFRIKPVVENMSQSKWKGEFCKQNKLAISANFVCKFNTKHAVEEQCQCLEESQNCFESKVAEGFRFIDLNFFIEQLRRGCCTCKSIISHANGIFF